MSRVNFASRQLDDVNKPGVQAIVQHVRAQGPRLVPERVVDICLEVMGPLSVEARTRQQLVDHLAAAGDVDFESNGAAVGAAARIRELLQLLVATREYQLA
jgi:hypothetical protein